MNKKFKTTTLYNCVKINKGEKEITIKKDLDDSLWISGNKNQDTTINLNVTSFDYDEFKTYHIFYDLAKNILGKYMFQDYKQPHNFLPKDFINIKDKEIVYHTDAEATSCLKIKMEQSSISISIIKEKYLDSDIIQNSVKIERNSYNYGNYYEEFAKFYEELYKYYHVTKKEKGYQKRLQK